jgi:hypothetical protein
MMNKYKLGAYDANTGKADQVDALITLAAGRALRRGWNRPVASRRAGIHHQGLTIHAADLGTLSRPEISALVMLLVVVAGFALYAPQFASSGNIRVMLFALPRSASWRWGRHPDDRRRVRPVSGLGVRAAHADGVAMGKWGVAPSSRSCWARPWRWAMSMVDHASVLDPELRHHARHDVHGALGRRGAVGRLPAPVPRRFPDRHLRCRPRPVPRLDDLVAGFAVVLGVFSTSNPATGSMPPAASRRQPPTWASTPGG